MHCVYAHGAISMRKEESVQNTIHFRWLKMRSKVYKWCAVPLCKNTSKSTPHKLFIYVPNKKIVRDKWLKLAWRNPSAVVTNSSIYFCEDHFDLPNDMENYMRYHVMGSVSQVRMKSGCIPTKFTCQPDRKTRTSDTIERPYIRKKRKMMAFEECMVTEYTDLEEIGSRSPVSPNKEENMHFGDLEYLTKSESEQCDTSSNLIQDNVEIKEEPLLEIKEEPLVDIKEEPLVEIKEEPLVDIKEELLVEIKNEPLVKIKEEPLVEIKEEPLVEIKIEQND